MDNTTEVVATLRQHEGGGDKLLVVTTIAMTERVAMTKRMPHIIKAMKLSR